MNLEEFYAELDENDRANRGLGWETRIATRAGFLAGRPANDPRVAGSSRTGPSGLRAAEVPAAAIADRVRQRAEAALAYCRARPGLAALTLHWFRADFDRSALGMTVPGSNELWLSADQPAPIRSVLHEARHAEQYKSLPAGDWRLADTPEGLRWREDDANAFADLHLRYVR